MKKQSKQLVFLLVVLVLLIAGFLGMRVYNEKEAQKASQKDTGITLIDAAAADVVRYSYNYEGATYTYEREDGTWYCADDHSLNMNQSRLTTLLHPFTPLMSQQKIENVTDYAQYGLEEPTGTVTIATADAEYTVYVGDYNSITYAFYLKMEGDDAVYVTTSVINGLFGKTTEDLIAEPEETTE